MNDNVLNVMDETLEWEWTGPRQFLYEAQYEDKSRLWQVAGGDQ